MQRIFFLLNNAFTYHIMFTREELPTQIWTQSTGIQTLGKHLGSGTFCSVFALENDKRVIKLYSQKNQFRNELAIINALQRQHCAIEEILDSGALIIHAREKCAIIPFTIMPNYEISLATFIENTVRDTGAGLPMLNTITVARQLFRALHILEQNNIIHGDIKPENILLRNVHDLQIVLCDFGCAIQLPDSEPCIYVGTIPYIAPEVLIKHSITMKSDVWSVMATIFYVITGNDLFDVLGYDNRNDNEFRGVYVECVSSDSLDYNSFQTVYAHIAFMFKRIGKPPKEFIDICPQYYNNGAPRYAQAMRASNIASILAKYYAIRYDHAQLLDNFLMLGLQYMPAQRKSPSEILNHKLFKKQMKKICKICKK